MVTSFSHQSNNTNARKNHQGNQIMYTTPGLKHHQWNHIKNRWRSKNHQWNNIMDTPPRFKHHQLNHVMNTLRFKNHKSNQTMFIPCPFKSHLWNQIIKMKISPKILHLSKSKLRLLEKVRWSKKESRIGVYQRNNLLRHYNHMREDY